LSDRTLFAAKSQPRLRNSTLAAHDSGERGPALPHSRELQTLVDGADMDKPSNADMNVRRRFSVD
jgi:hypothetical protein